MKVAVIRNACSKYSVIQHMEEALIRALRANHVEVISSELDEEGYTRLYNAFENETISCTISINQVLGKSLFHVPHILLSLDDPFWHETDILLSPHVVTCFPDVDSDSYMENTLRKKSFLFPHACELEPYREQEKTIPLLFPASYLDDEAEYRNWQTEWGKTKAKTLLEEAFLFLENPSASFFDTLEKMFELVRSPHIDVMKCFRSFDVCIRGLDRQRLLQKVSSAEIHMVGDEKSFEQYKKRNSQCRFVYEGEKSFSELVSLLARSRCVLQSLPTRRKSLHERTLYALSQGCLLYTTTSTTLPFWLQKEGIVSFHDQNQALPHCASQKAFHNTWKWIQAEHTWKARVTTLFPQLLQEADVCLRTCQEIDPFSSLF